MECNLAIKRWNQKLMSREYWNKQLGDRNILSSTGLHIYFNCENLNDFKF